MVADRRASFDGWLGPYKVEKIARAEGILVGVSGPGALLGRVREILGNKTLPVDTAGAIGQLVNLQREREGKEPACLLVVTRGALLEIDPSGGCFHLEQDVWAIGNGSMTAMGWLKGYAHARSRRLDSIEPALGEEAIRYVSTVQTSVGDGCQAEWLVREDE